MEGRNEAAIFTLLAQVGRERDAVLDHAVMHVHEVKGAFGAGERADGAEALVGRGDELLLVVERRTLDQALIGIEHQSLHEITRRLADERVTIGISREEIRTIDPRATSRGALLELEVAEHLRPVTSIDTRIDANGPDGLIGGGLGIEAGITTEGGVAEQVARVDDVDAQEVAVVIGIQAAVVVLRQAPLPAEVTGGADPLTVVELKARGVGADVEPAVVAPEQRIRSAFGIGELRAGWVDAHAEVRRDLDFFVGLTVTVRIAAEPEMRWGADQRAIAMKDERARQNDIIQEDRALIHAAIAVGIFEHHHAALRLVFRRPVKVFHVARHLDDPEAAIGCELQHRRVADQRGFGDELDAVARGDLETAERFFGRERGRRRDQVRRHDRHLGFAGLIADLRAGGGRQAEDG